MELRHVRYFVAVAELQNFSRAAEKLRISQPPLSAQIHSLEDEIGARLFDRSSRGATLTEVGRAFLPKARALLIAAQEAKEVAKTSARENSEFRIGIIPPALTEKFATKLRAFQLAHPDLRLRIRHDNVSVLHGLIKAGELDVVLTRPFRAEPQLMQRCVEWHEQLLALPADHPLAKQTSIPWSLLTGVRVLLIGPEFNALYGQNFLHMCGRHEATPDVDYAASDLGSLIWLVSAGFGVCPYPSSLAEAAPKTVVFRPFAPPSRKIELVVMWPSHRLSPTSNHFVETFAEAISSRAAPRLD